MTEEMTSLTAFDHFSKPQLHLEPTSLPLASFVPFMDTQIFSFPHNTRIFFSMFLHRTSVDSFSSKVTRLEDLSKYT
jgi:hypothetical protein